MDGARITGGRSGRQPPSANRGVENEGKAFRFIGKKGVSVENRGIDYLTLTAGPRGASALMLQTKDDEPGIAVRGFKKTEQRLCLGGVCWRRWEPVTPSNAHGLNYESWEWSSTVAGVMARELIGVDELRPTRVDIAFDFIVPESMKADYLIKRCKKWIEGRALTIGISGTDGVNTRYVGSAKSSRRIRIYRWDLRHDDLFDDRAIMRVELVLREEHAELFWTQWQKDVEWAYAAAAAHIREMMGLEVGLIGEVPERAPEPVLDEAQEVFEFFKQHACTISTLQVAGFDVLALAHEFKSSASQATKYRHRSRLKRLTGVGVELIARAVCSMFEASQNSAITSYPAV